VTEQPNTQTPKVPVQDPNYSHVGDTSSEEGKTYSVLDRKDDRGGKSRGKIGPKQNGGEYSSLEQKVREFELWDCAACMVKVILVRLSMIQTSMGLKISFILRSDLMLESSSPIIQLL
jgi:hypothetical protein